MKKLFLLLSVVLVSVSMSAKTYVGSVYQDTNPRQYLETLPYGEDGTFTINVKVSDDKSTVTVMGWSGYMTDDDVVLTLDADGVATTINGVSFPTDKGYYSVWVNCGGLNDGNYGGIYVYGGTPTDGDYAGIPNAKVTFNEDGTGQGYFRVRSYDATYGGNKCIYFRWTTEEVEEIAVTDYPCLVSKTDGSYPYINYDENGEFLTTISVPADNSYVILHNWSGEADGSGDNLKMYIDPETFGISLVNGDADGCYPLLYSTTDGEYNYAYVYAGGYGDIEMEEDGSEGAGYAWVYSYGDDATYTLDFQWPGELGMGIKNVEATTGNNAIYNIAGQRVAGNFKGIAIKNGKKYINK